MKTPMPYTPVHSFAELTELWAGLMGEWGFDQSSLWIIFFDEDDRMQPTIMPIDGLPSEPDELFVRNVGRVLADIVDHGIAASVALLVSRPGPTAMTEDDRRWARALHEALAGLGRWPIHLGTRGRVQVFAPDDLIAA